jgi:hypothetical protein
MRGVLEEEDHDNLFFNRERLLVANQRQQILGIVVQVVVPWIFLDFEKRLLIVLDERFVHLVAQRLELLHGRQQKWIDPLCLVRILLTLFQSKHWNYRLLLC